MADTSTQVSQSGSALNGASLEAKLRRLYARQKQLREQMEAAQAELGHINAEVLRTQDEYCTNLEREEEFWQCQKNIFGYDPRELLKEIDEAKINPVSFDDLIKELEQIGGS